MKKIILGALCLMAGVASLAKMPPLSDEAKAKADEAKAKTAWSDKVAAYRLCLSQDKAAARYFSNMKEQAKEVKPAIAAPACADPGPYVPAGPAVVSLPAPAAPAEKPIPNKP